MVRKQTDYAGPLKVKGSQLEAMYAQQAFEVNRRLAEELYRERGDKIVVADIGGGDLIKDKGRHFRILQDYARLYINVEPSMVMLSHILQGKALQEAGFHCLLVRAFGEEVPLKTEVADLVFILFTLDHCFDPQKVISESYRILKPGGRILINLTNDRSYYKRLLLPYARKLRKKSEIHHNWFFSPKDVRSLLTKAGFQKITTIDYAYLRLPLVVEKLLGFLLKPQRVARIDKAFSKVLPNAGGWFITVGVK